MDKIFLIICFLITSLLGECEAASGKKDVVTINMQNPEWIDFKNYITDIRCFSFEKHEGVYPRSVRKVIYYRQHFYILSYEGFSVYIYNEKGEFVNIIKPRLSGKNSFYPHNIFIDEVNDKLYVPSMVGDKINAYDLGGHWVGQFSFGMKIVNMCRYEGSRFFVFNGGYNQNLSYSLFLKDMAKPLFQKELLLKTKKQRREGSNPWTVFSTERKSGVAYSLFPNNDTIYISNQRENVLFSPYYYLDFAGEFFNDKVYPDKGLSMKEEAELIKSKKYVLSIQNFFAVSGKLFFSLSGKMNDYYMLDIKKNKLLAFKNYFPGNPMFLVGNTSDQLIVSSTPDDIRQYYLRSKSMSLNPDLKVFVDDIKDKDQFIILLLKIK